MMEVKANVRGAEHLRIATYNIHKSRGLDGRVRPQRIVEVLRELDADFIALQEVVSREGTGRAGDQARYFAEELGYDSAMGENRTHQGGAYGNVVLTRFPIHALENYDISTAGRERRGCLRADVRLGKAVLHIFNVHMGTAFFERRKQARKLLGAEILGSGELTGARIVLGDFNDWSRGLPSRLFAARFHSADPRRYLGRASTYPGVLPFLHLDHIYFDPSLKLNRLNLHRSKKALLASDHLPLVADFTWRSATAAARPDLPGVDRACRATDMSVPSHPRPSLVRPV
jgi:endonuclease/exonuclease/phosphatase family metal-dependent hydrolase